ncbi:baeRF2 domain-containing protein [Cellulomonas sp. NPDC055163]
MKLDWLKPLLGRTGPFTTVYLDATRADAAGETEVLDRWKGLRRELDRQGAPATLLDEIEERVATQTRVPGPHGRVLIADSQGVAIDRVLADPPASNSAVHGPVPSLLPAARAADEAVSYLLVQVDRQGADLYWSDEAGRLDGRQHDVVEGDHDVIRKVRSGDGWAHRRMQMRAEDSWERNAETVAAEIDRQVVDRCPELVVLTGDVREVPLLREALGHRTKELVVDVPGGSRAEGVKQDAFDERVQATLEAFRARRREEVLDRFRQEQGRAGAAVTQLGDVIAVLQRGQVAELVLHESVSTPASALAERTVWVGPDPLQIAVDRAGLEAMGVDEGARELRADIAVVRAALGQDAGLTFAVDGSVDLIDGVGAVLRWHDPSTPSESLLTQSGDRTRVHDVV